jgi:acetyl esterase/lipase
MLRKEAASQHLQPPHVTGKVAMTPRATCAGSGGRPLRGRRRCRPPRSAASAGTTSRAAGIPGWRHRELPVHFRPDAAERAGGRKSAVILHVNGGGFVIGTGNSDNTLLASTGDEVIVS